MMRSKQSLSYCIAILCFLLCSSLMAQYEINDLGDTSDFDPGDGYCADANGLCTLRAAIQEANAVADDITTAVTGTISLGSDLDFLIVSGITIDLNSDITIDGGAVSASILTVTGNNNNLLGFTLTGGSLDGLDIIGDGNSVTDVTSVNNDRHGVKCGGSGSTFSSCVLENNSDGGIWIGGDDHTIDDCSINNNGNDSGIKMTSGSNRIITNNQVYQNGQSGISIFGGSGDEISDNSCYDNDVMGISVRTGDYTVRNNNINMNGNSGLELWNADNSSVEDNVIDNNSATGIFLTNTSDNVVLLTNQVTNNNIGITVNGSSGAYSDGDVCTDNALHGVYVFSSADFLANNLQSDDNGGDGLFADQSANIDLSSNTSFDGNADNGIEISECDNATIVFNTADGNTSNGLLLLNSDNSTISDNTFSNNGGEGVSLTTCLTSTIELNTIDNNSGGGILIQQGGAITIDANQVTNNQNDGGISVFNSGGSVDITGGNLVSGNDPSGIVGDSNGALTISDNVISTNGSEAGVKLTFSHNTVLADNTIEDNTGNGVQFGNSNNIDISGNSIQNNSAIGLMIESSSSNPSVDNNNISNNGDEGVTISGSDNGQIESNDINDNSGSGILFSGSSANTTVSLNTLGNNSIAGVRIVNGSSADVTENEFSCNGLSGITNLVDDIDPVITIASEALIMGTACSGCLIELYANHGCSDCQGEVYETVVTASGGDWSYTGGAFSAGDEVAVIARDGSTTSEFVCAALCDTPENNECGDAIELSFDTVIQEDNICAEGESLDCGANEDHTLWYEFETTTIDISFQLRTTADGASTPFTIELYESCGGSPVRTSCNAFWGTNYQCLEPNTTYYVAVGSATGNAGTYEIELATLSIDHEVCEDALDLGSIDCGETMVLNDGSLGGACSEENSNCLGGSSWIVVTLESDVDELEIISNSSSGSEIYEGDCSSLSLISDGFSGCSYGIGERIPVTGGEEIYIQAEFYGYLEVQAFCCGDFDNDECADAFEIDEGTAHTDNNSCATSNSTSCGVLDHVVWYECNVGEAARLEIEVTGISNAAVEVYFDCGASTGVFECDNSIPLSICVEPFGNFLILVGTDAADVGEFEITVTEIVDDADFCEVANDLGELDCDGELVTESGTYNCVDSEASGCLVGQGGIWNTFTVDNEVLEFSFENTSSNWELFEGSNCNNLNSLGSCNAGPFINNGDPFFLLTEDPSPSFEIVPDCPCDLLEANLDNVECNDNGTPLDPSDDFVSFEIDPEGDYLADGYSVLISAGTITPATADYGGVELFELQAGSPGFGDVTLTILDDDDMDCMIEVTIDDPGTCCEQPTNQDCDDAITLSSGVTESTGNMCNFTATNSGCEAYAHTLWYEFTTSATTSLIEFEIDELANPFFEIFEDCGSMQLYSFCSNEEQDICVLPNTTYFFAVGSADLSADLFDLTVNEYTTTADICAGANDLGTLACLDMLTTDPGVNSCDDAEASGCLSGSAGIWNRFSLDGDILDFTLENTSGDWELYEGNDCDDLTLVGSCDTGPFDNNGEDFYLLTDDENPDFDIIPRCACEILDINLENIECDDNGTPEDPRDDFIFFELEPEGDYVGSSYLVSVSSGTVSPQTALYDEVTVFMLEAGTAGAGDVVITITDVDDMDCEFEDDIEDPGSCCVEPENLDCDDAIQISSGTGVSGINVCISSPGESNCADDAHGLWYEYTTADDATYLQYNIDNLSDPFFEIYDECGGDLLYENCGDSDMDICIFPNTTYYIFLGSDLEDADIFDFEVEDYPGESSDGCLESTDYGVLECDSPIVIVTDAEACPDGEAEGCMINVPGVWQTFSVDESIAEFTISVDGNDSWEIFEGDGCDDLDGIQDCGNNIAIQNNGDPFYLLMEDFSEITIEAICCETEELAITEEICEGEFIVVGGNIYNMTVVDEMVLLEAANEEDCDTIATLNLTVNEFTRVMIDTSLCEGESLTVGPNTYTTTVMNEEVILPSMTTEDCDTLVTVNLEVLPIPTLMLDESICTGESYILGPNTYTMSVANEVVILPAVLPDICDTIATLNLNVADNIEITVDESICTGESFVLGGNTYTTSVTNEEIFVNSTVMGECDTVYTLNLTVADNVEVNLDESICEGDTYQVAGMTYTTTVMNEQIIVPSVNLGECDTLITLNLTVKELELEFVSETICDGETFVVAGNSYTTPQVETEILIPSIVPDLCDTLLTLNLAVIDIVELTFNESICTGETYVLGGNSYTSEVIGESVVLPSSQAGECDTMATLNLTVADDILLTIDEMICTGDTYEIGGNSYSSTVLGEEVMIPSVNAGECDTLVTLNLEVLDNIPVSIQASICSGDSYQLGGNTYTMSVVGEEVMIPSVNAGECDTLVTLDLDVVDNIPQSINASICDGEVYQVAGNSYTTAQVDEEILIPSQVAGDCDTLLTLNLEIREKVREEVVGSICIGEVFTFRGVDYTDELTDQEVELPSVVEGECDTIFNLNLEVRANVEEAVMASICTGETYTFRGVDYTSSLIDERIDVPSVNAGECDTTFTLNLIVDDNVRLTLNEEICNGASYTLGGNSYSDEVNGEEVFIASVNAGECDTIYTLNLALVNNIEQVLDEQICAGGSFELGGNSYTSTLTDEQIVLPSANSNECDTLVLLTLEVLDLETLNEDAEICDGGSYVFGGNTYMTEQVNTMVTLPASNANECDTLAILNLTIIEAFSESVSEEICDGETSTPIGNETFTTTGFYDVSLQSVQGCDSVVTLNLSVLEPSEFMLEEQRCLGETVTIGGQDFTSDDNGTILLPGADVNGCDSIINYNLSFKAELLTELNEQLCNGESYLFGSDELVESGTYTQSLVTASGCDSTVTLTLTQLDYLDEDQVFLSESLSNNDFPFNFDLLARINLNGANESDLTVDIDQNLPRGVVLSYEDGILNFSTNALVKENLVVEFTICHTSCEDDCTTGIIELMISDDLDCFVDETYRIASGITPNGDGKNDVFYMDVLNQCGDLFLDKELTVYNRWGSQVYSAKPYMNDWDGGDLVEGVYYYVMEFDLVKGLIKTGNVTIIR